MMEAMSIQHHHQQQHQELQEQHQNPVRRMDEPFPLKLHRLLNDVEHTPQAGILAWDPEGRSFTIFQPKEFAESIMGQYFRQTKYKSFQRQMNLYGFSREVRGKIRGVYSHPLFIRNDRDLCLQIKRSNRVPARSFGSPSHSSMILNGNNSNDNTNINTNTAPVEAAATIDVSSPLFAPLKLLPEQASMNRGVGGMNNTANVISLGMAQGVPRQHSSTTTTTTTTKTMQHYNHFIPSFTLPVGGLSNVYSSASSSAAKQISLDDGEESMGTIDELPSNSDSLGFFFGEEEEFIANTAPNTASDDFAPVAV
ncbi:unnamed protein product [Cylindrotheca closterium]|uniref:HSF-type DNA-binding domain-containing protein n=1 Tax=Cylindrotheca closterium TaxID=2856 RepID=A0AAD2GA91_9STRA|nr:unnamed protein product [Cylindrotheca closterium]